MELCFKPDADRVLDRFEQWWDCRNETPLIEMRAYEPYQPSRPPVETVEACWFDFDRRIADFEEAAVHTHFLADSLPMFNPNMGPDLLATLWGAEMEFAWDTTWISPTASTCAEVRAIEPSFDGRLWRLVEEFTRRSVAAGAGKWMTCFHDLHPNADVPAALMGPETLCLEFADDPDEVKATVEAVTPTCIEAYERLIRLTGTPSVTWLPAPAKGRMYVPQCDFSAMVSTAMFVEAILPSIQCELGATDRGIYHLDGPDALRHLDVLLETPGIHGIQWVYGAGKGPARRWVDVYRKIQKAGRCMQVIVEELEDVVELQQHLEPQGVLYSVGPTLPVEEAKAFIRSVGTPV